MSDLYKNFAYCTTTAAITSNTQTTVTVDDVSRLPTNAQLAASDFYMTLESTLAANAFEIVKVTSKVTSGSISDTFDRSNGLVTAGQTGYDSSTTAHIVSNKATASTNTEQIALVYNGGDFDLTVDVVVTGSDGFYVVPGAGAAASMVFETTDKVSFRSRVDNSLLFSSGSGSLSGISSGTFRFRISGTVWTISRNGSVLLTHDFGANARTGPATITLFTDHTVDNLVYVDTASSLTIVRGQESTTAQSSIASGTVMKASLTAAMVSRLTVQGIPTVSRPQGTLLRRYTFDSDIQSWTVDLGSLSQVNGALRITDASGRDKAALEPGTAGNVADGEVYADFRASSTASGELNVGVLLRATDASNHYMVVVFPGRTTGNAVELYKRVSGTYSLLASTGSESPNIPKMPTTVTNLRLMVRFVGSAISVYLNEVFLFSAVDTTYTTGRCGLYAWNTGTIDYDNVSVYSLASNWTPANYDATLATASQVQVIPTLNRPQGTLLRRYTFDSDTQSWAANKGTYSNVSGRLRYTYASSPSDGINVGLEPSTATPVADGEIYADIYPVTEGGDGWDSCYILFRATDANNFYYTGITTSKTASGVTSAALIGVGKRVAGTFTGLAGSAASGNPTTTPIPVLPASGPWRLMIRFVGSVIQVYLNETLVAAVKDTTYTTGIVGTMLQNFDNSGTPVVDFDNISVYTLSSSWTPANYDATLQTLVQSGAPLRRYTRSIPAQSTGTLATSAPFTLVVGSQIPLPASALPRIVCYSGFINFTNLSGQRRWSATIDRGVTSSIVFGSPNHIGGTADADTAGITVEIAGILEVPGDNAAHTVEFTCVPQSTTTTTTINTGALIYDVYEAPTTDPIYIGATPQVASVIPTINRPQGTLLRRYTFDNDTQSFTTDNGALTQVSGRLRATLAVAAQGDILEPSTAGNVSDGEVYADLYPVTADTNGVHDVGVIFRATDASNHYLLAVRAGTSSASTQDIQLFKKVGGSYTSLGGSPASTAMNIPYYNNTVGAGPLRVMVRFVGSQIQAFVNEMFVGAWNDATYSTGRLGVRTANVGTSPATVVDYDNISVYQLASTWAPANYDPIPTTTVAQVPMIALPQGTQQRQYTFDSSTQSWTVDAAATLSVSSGRLLFAKSSNNTDSAALEPSGVSNVADGEVYADYLGITSSTATNNGVDQVGVIFRATDANNHYMVLISLGVPTSVVRWISLWKRVSGTYTALASTPTGTTAVPPINLSRDQAQRIMVRYVGSAVSVYLNETLVLEAVDTTYTTGRVGLYAATQASYLFDNVTVLSLPSTWTPALYTPVAAAGDSSWTALTPNSTWSNLGSPYAPISCRKDAMGFVHLEGAVTAGGGFGPVLITTLPAGYRPGHTIRPPATFYLSGSFSSAGTVTITTAGAVSLDSAGTGSVNNAALDGITFFAEN